MPRVNIPVTQLDQAGVAPPAQVTADAANDHELPFNDGRIFLEITNVNAGAAASAIFQTPGVLGGTLQIDDLTVTVPQSASRLVGPLRPDLFNQVDGKVNIDVTTADLRFRAYRL
jgi:hypothetical protein